jgi:predicted CXXCH cytochrome family protein
VPPALTLAAARASPMVPFRARLATVPRRRAGRTWPRLPAVLLAVAGALAGCQRSGDALAGQAGAPGTAAPAFVGAAACAGCHAREAQAVRGSDHDRAMQPAGPTTVLGDFSGARFTHRGVTSVFRRRDGTYVVRTEGPDGRPGDFEVAYTFGVRPLQQYLVPFPGGRLQVLDVAWDSRPRARGGQRWYALYPGERFRPHDPLHWTGREQTWNFQCAECHSTDLRKGYDLAARRYATTWAELTVSCEACHGPGSAHVAWARARPPGAPPAGGEATALVVRLGRGAGAWEIAEGRARWRGPPRGGHEVEACARCHARRRPIADPYVYGQPLLDTHQPALLAEGIYHADGQILGEVYEYGSFLQSRMYRAGVTCSDCHEPHGLGLRAPGNGVCAGCHAPARFDTPAHHRHRRESAAARCIACHMPARTYMGVDVRRDHSLPVPRPDLSVAIGTPNACTGCHTGEGARWAARVVRRWYGPGRAPRPHFALALEAGRRGHLDAEPRLAALATDREQPGIARATALSLLAEFLTPASLPAVAAGLDDPDALVRAAAAGAAEGVPPDRRAGLVAPALRDPVRAVRVAAARIVAGVHGGVPADRRPDFEAALGELVASELVSAERPEAHVNLATLYARLGRPADARAALSTALSLDPRFVPALLGLADLARAEGRDDEGERRLEEALRLDPESAEALHGLALVRVRQRRQGEALALLRRAAALRPGSRFGYVYAIALHSAGDSGRALAVLEALHRRRPADREVLSALVSVARERRDVPRALRHAETLARLLPGDPDVQALRDALRRQGGAR